MYGNQPMKIQEICYEDGRIKEIFNNRDVYMIYPDDFSPTGRVEKQESLTEQQFEELKQSMHSIEVEFLKKCKIQNK